MKLTLALLFLFALCFSRFQKQERLYELDGKRFYMTPEQLETLPTEIRSKVIDVTFIPHNYPLVQQQFPDRLSQQSIVRPLLTKIESEGPQRIRDLIKTFSSYPNRRYDSQNGLKSAEWLRDQYLQVINSLSPERKSLFNVTFFKHRSFIQPSVIVTFKGSSSEAVIIGGHIDTVTVAPGADDNGSGTSTVFETFRMIATSNFVPKKTLEFHGYAAEEIGAVGSREIAQQYKNSGRKVYAFMNFDMDGYNGNNHNSMAIDSGYSTSSSLRQFILIAAKEYVGIKYFTRNYFGGSDHSSWNSAGYHVGNLFEGVVSPHWHRSTDVLENVDPKYISEFVKITTGVMIELSAF